jgi:hypothetical protein
MEASTEFQCPNCGHTEADDDGDCLRCHEPDIVSVVKPFEGDEVAMKELYDKLDHEIRDTLLDFVRCGRALKEMRDSQAYLAHYPTFEEYVKAVEGMSLRYARDQIRASIVYGTLESGGNHGFLPESERQVRALANAAVFKEQVEVREKPNGGKVTIKQPVAVKNAGQVRKIWSKIQKEYEAQRKKEEAEGKTPRKLTSSFIIDRLPDDFKPQHILGIRNANTATRLTQAIDKLPKLIESRNMLEGDRLKTIMEKEEWSDNDRKQLADAIAESRQILDAIARLL